MLAQSEAIVRRLAAHIGDGRRGEALARKLAGEGIRTLRGLRRPSTLSRLPRAVQASVRYAPARTIPRALACAVAREMRRRLEFAAPVASPRPRVVPVGGLRRGAPVLKDIDMLVVGWDVPLASATLRRPRMGDRVAIADMYASGPRRLSLILRVVGGARPYLRADIFAATPAERAYALYHYTGPKSYNIRIRAHARRRGWLLNQYGLYDAATRRPVPGAAGVTSERALSALLGVTHRQPAARA
jgi:DNA polymerase/3'-5' exonuclease PolX